jgi:hypothetical protein
MWYHTPAHALLNNKGKGRRRRGHEAPESGSTGIALLFVTSALDAEEWSTPSPGRFSPHEEI